MPKFDQTIATLHRRGADGGLAYLGTAFAFRGGGAFLTAAHCVASLDSGEVVLTAPRLNQGVPSPVSSIVSHGSADVAVVKVEGAHRHLLAPFYILE